MDFAKPYMQNRELSWLSFNERVLDLGNEESLPILERLNFVSIFWSNLQEFFMVRVGSITDLGLLKQGIVDNKTGWTPAETTHRYLCALRRALSHSRKHIQAGRHLLARRRHPTSLSS